MRSKYFIILKIVIYQKYTRLFLFYYFKIKLEPVKSKSPQLLYEYKLYKLLQGGTGIAEAFWFGVEGDYNVMVMEFLGPSLENLFTLCGKKFSLKTVLMVGDQILRRIEYIHSKNFIHRDIKPENFVLGTGDKSSIIYCIDFGLSKKYRDSKHVHIPYSEDKSLTGTARYASINTHLGIEQSRRDDIESIAYVLIYLAKGSLPWQTIKGCDEVGMKGSEKYKKLSESKFTITAEKLCEGLPSEFALFLNYSRSLNFEDKPDYLYLRKLLRSVFIKEKCTLDGVFDWNLVEGTPVPFKPPSPSTPQQSSPPPSSSSRKHRNSIAVCGEHDYDRHKKKRYSTLEKEKHHSKKKDK